MTVYLCTTAYCLGFNVMYSSFYSFLIMFIKLLFTPSEILQRILFTPFAIFMRIKMQIALKNSEKIHFVDTSYCTFIRVCM